MLIKKIKDFLQKESFKIENNVFFLFVQKIDLFNYFLKDLTNMFTETEKMYFSVLKSHDICLNYSNEKVYIKWVDENNILQKEYKASSSRFNPFYISFHNEFKIINENLLRTIPSFYVHFFKSFWEPLRKCFKTKKEAVERFEASRKEKEEQNKKQNLCIFIKGSNHFFKTKLRGINADTLKLERVSIQENKEYIYYLDSKNVLNRNMWSREQNGEMQHNFDYLYEKFQSLLECINDFVCFRKITNIFEMDPSAFYDFVKFIRADGFLGTGMKGYGEVCKINISKNLKYKLVFLYMLKNGFIERISYKEFDFKKIHFNKIKNEYVIYRNLYLKDVEKTNWFFNEELELLNKYIN